jgi:hypothetical protein
MAIAQSTGLRQAIATAYDIFNSGILEIRSGAAAGPNAAGGGTLLASIALPADAFSGPATGVLTKSGTWSDASADAGGTAAHFRLMTSGDSGGASSSEERIEGSVGTSGADLILDSVTITLGQTVTINTATITVPAS